MRRSATLSKILGAMLLAASLSTAVGRPLACPPEMAPIAGLSACIDRRETAALIGGGHGNDDDDDNLSCSPEDPIAQPLTQQTDGGLLLRDLG